MLKRLTKWSKSTSILSDKMLLKNNGSVISFVLMLLEFVLALTIICSSTQFACVPVIVYCILMVILVVSFILDLIFTLISA